MLTDLCISSLVSGAFGFFVHSSVGYTSISNWRGEYGSSFIFSDDTLAHRSGRKHRI